MLTRKFIYNEYRKKYRGQLFRHSKNSANIISRLTRLCDKFNLEYKYNTVLPENLIVKTKQKYISVFVGGFNNRIDMLPYKKNGQSYDSKYEVAFMTPVSAVNYILKKWNKNERS